MGWKLDYEANHSRNGCHRGSNVNVTNSNHRFQKQLLTKRLSQRQYINHRGQSNRWRNGPHRWKDGRNLGNWSTVSYPTPSSRDFTYRRIFLRNQITAISKPNNNNIPKKHQHSAVCTGGMLKGENPVSDYWWADWWVGNWIMEPRFVQEIRFLYNFDCFKVFCLHVRYKKYYNMKI